MTHLTVKNEITITDLPPNLVAKLKASLTIPNKDFEKMKRMGVWAPREYIYWQLGRNGELIVPRGCLTRLTDWLGRAKEAYSVKNELVHVPAKFGASKVVLRPYQTEIVDRIVDKRPSEGIIVMSTGAGKTITALEIINRLGLTATILVQNTLLLDQFAGEAKFFYDIEPAIINAKRKEKGSLTIATFQSLANKERRKELAARTSVLIIDEVQGIPSTKRAEVLRAFAPSFLLGLTATPNRSDSLAPAISFLCGNPIANHEALACTPSVQIIQTREKLVMSDKYHDMVEAMINNVSRNKLIVGLVTGEVMSGRKVLVLTKRVEHYKILERMMPPILGAHYIDADDPNRNDLLSKFKTNDLMFTAIFGTTSLLAVGMDIPALDTLILACDMKSSVLSTQSVGRILRLFAGKKEPKVLDLHDNFHPIFSRQFRERQQVYKQKKWPIIN